MNHVYTAKITYAFKILQIEQKFVRTEVLKKLQNLSHKHQKS